MINHSVYHGVNWVIFIINMTDRPWRNSDMARPRKNNITIDEEIIKQEEQVSKSKAKYDADVKKTQRSLCQEG